MKKKPIVPPPEKTVIAGTETTFEGRLECALTTAFTRGYTLSCPPVFVGNEIPRGRTALAGFHPHFLIVFQKLPITLNQ